MPETKPNYAVMIGLAKCPTEELHTDVEEEKLTYVGWHEWAVAKAKTHIQQKCPGCGLYKIWVPRDA